MRPTTQWPHEGVDDKNVHGMFSSSFGSQAVLSGRQVTATLAHGRSRQFHNAAATPWSSICSWLRYCLLWHALCYSTVTPKADWLGTARSSENFLGTAAHKQSMSVNTPKSTSKWHDLDITNSPIDSPTKGSTSH